MRFKAIVIPYWIALSIDGFSAAAFICCFICIGRSEGKPDKNTNWMLFIIT